MAIQNPLLKIMMEQLNNKSGIEKSFIAVSLLILFVGMCFGLTGALQYILPGFLKSSLSFEKVRPLHVSSVVFWIIFGAMGTVLSYLQEHGAKKKYSASLIKLQFVIFVCTLIAILISYLTGNFGGREYWEFPPYLSIPIVAGWILFIINFIRSVKSFKKQPVYFWMWITGLVFFLFTFIESYLWLLPFFGKDVIKDMTIQWKSYGSMVGSWNMLLYGSGIYLMDKISKNNKYSTSGIAFSLYFLGLFNLMFNWGHHIYTLPTESYVKHLSYAVSMTELFIFGRIIYLWKSSLTEAQKNFHKDSYMFLIAADVWVFLTLAVAIFMSVPAFNVYTHGTHITVAHTMGATIGINTMLLMAFAHDLIIGTGVKYQTKTIKFGFWLANISLFIFWISLLGAGVSKAIWQFSANQTSFSIMMKNLQPYFKVFFVSGLFLAGGLSAICFSILKFYLKNSIEEFRIKFSRLSTN